MKIDNLYNYDTNFFKSTEEEFNINCNSLKICNNNDLFIEILEKNPIIKKQIEYINISNNDKLKKIIFDKKKYLYKYIINGKILNPTLFFNGSIIPNPNNDETYIFVYRTDLNYNNTRFCIYINIHICLLDKNFNIINKPKLLNVITYINKTKDSFLKSLKLEDGNHAEDPRLFNYNNNIFISYGDGYNMYLGLINKTDLTIIKSDIINCPFETIIEKNWVSLIKNNILYFVYSYSPFIIFEMNKNNLWQIKKIHHILINSNIQDKINNWEYKYGKIRGGTPFIYLEDIKKYISVFHSSKTLLNDLINSKIYFSGIILLDEDYNINNVSSKPLYTPNIINPITERLNNRICVVFPSGIFQQNNNIYVSCGENDENNIILQFNINEINNLLD